MKFLKIKNIFLKKNDGIVALSLVLLIVGIAVEFAVTLALVNLFVMKSNFGAKNANEALFMANNGVNEAVIKLIRNKNYIGSFILSNDNGFQAQVSVSSPDLNKNEIISLGMGFGKNRKLEAIIYNNPNGEIKIESIKEVSL